MGAALQPTRFSNPEGVFMSRMQHSSLSILSAGGASLARGALVIVSAGHRLVAARR